MFVNLALSSFLQMQTCEVSNSSALGNSASNEEYVLSTGGADMVGVGSVKTEGDMGKVEGVIRLVTAGD